MSRYKLWPFFTYEMCLWKCCLQAARKCLCFSSLRLFLCSNAPSVNTVRAQLLRMQDYLIKWNQLCRAVVWLGIKSAYVCRFLLDVSGRLEDSRQRVLRVQPLQREPWHREPEPAGAGQGGPEKIPLLLWEGKTHASMYTETFREALNKHKFWGTKLMTFCMLFVLPKALCCV